MRLVLFPIALFLLGSTAAFAADARFGRTTVALEGSSEAQTVFKPDVPKIILHAEILDMPVGTKLTATWIAVKTDVAPANFKITSADVEIKQAVATDEASFFLTRPNAGWPVGDYEVDLSINGQAAASVSFKIAK